MKAIIHFLALAIALVPTCDAIVTVNVSASGTDNSTCLMGRSNCRTLGYALNKTSNNTIINVLYSHNLTTMIHLHNIANLTVFGDGTNITITCPVMGCGISFEMSVNISFYSIMWVDCSLKHPTTAVGNWSRKGYANLVNPRAYSAMFISNCTNIIIDHNIFTSSRGSGVSLYNVRGMVNVTNCVFHNHSIPSTLQCNNESSNSLCSPQVTGLYIEFSYCAQFTPYCYPDQSYFNGSHIYYHIWNCTFQDNQNSGAYRQFTDIVPSRGLRHEEHWPFGRGGGMGVVLRAYKIEHLHLSILDCHFINNSALFGGGVYLELESGHPNHNYFNLWGNHYHSNKAEFNGGALEITTDLLYETDIQLKLKMHNHFYLLENHFEKNKAYWGGGLSVVAYPTNIHYLSFIVSDSCWVENSHYGGAGSVGLLRKDKPDKFYFFMASVTFINCQFNSTQSTLAKGTSQAFVSGSFYSEGIDVSFNGSTVFCDNMASALALSDTGATFNGSIKFEHNSGFNGGAIRLIGKAWITLTDNVQVQFINNLATAFGGAIYYVPPAPLNMRTSTSCFVWYSSVGDRDVPLQYWSVNVTFIGNIAYQSGDAAYISDPQQCVWPNQTSIFNSSRTEKFNYSLQQNSSNIIATPPKTMSITVNGKNFISSNSTESYSTYSMMPGEKLDIRIETFDALKNSVPGTFSIKTYSVEDYENFNFSYNLCSGNGGHEVCRLSTSLITSNVDGPDLTIKGLPNKSLLLVFKSNNPVTIVLPLLVNLTNCSLGYQYDNSSMSCVCIEGNLATSPLLCLEETAISAPCIMSNYWFGTVEGVYSYHTCLPGKCRSYSNDSLKVCKNHHGFYRLPGKEDDLCARDLSGLLCSECRRDGHALSYNGYSCLSCDASKRIGLVLAILASCCLVVGILVGVVKCNIHVSTGGLYGFLYFYSVLPLFLWGGPHIGLRVVLSGIFSFASLDFQFLQYLKLCLFEQAIYYQAIQYAYPVIILLLVQAIVKLDQCIPRRWQFFSGNAAVQCLCIILLLAYTSVSDTSLNILLPIMYQSATNNESSSLKSYVYVDPGVPYFHPTRHLPFWLLALVVELFLVVPFAVFMFVAPWTMKFIRFAKVKHVVMEYQSCFQDRHRWFVGVYLIARQLLFLVTAISPTPEIKAYCQQILSVCILVLTASVQPYQNWLFNLVDVLILSLLTVISFSSYNPTANEVFHDMDRHNTVVCILSLLPCACVLLASIIAALYNLHKYIQRKKHRGQLNSVIDENSIFSTTIEQSIAGLRAPPTNRMDEDLPPRFYDEESDARNSDESTYLLRRNMGRSAYHSRTHHNPTNSDKKFVTK